MRGRGIVVGMVSLWAFNLLHFVHNFACCSRLAACRLNNRHMITCKACRKEAPASTRTQIKNASDCYITHLFHCWNGMGCHPQHVDSKKMKMMSFLVWQVFFNMPSTRGLCNVPKPIEASSGVLVYTRGRLCVHLVFVQYSG